MRENGAAGRQERWRPPVDFDDRVRLRRSHGIRRPVLVEGRAVDVGESDIVLEVLRRRHSASPPAGRLLVEFRLPPGAIAGQPAGRIRIPGRVAASPRPAGARNGSPQRLVVRFETRLTDAVARLPRRRCAIVGFLLIAFVMANVVVLKSQVVEYFWHRPALTLYGLGVTGYILSRFLIAFFYRAPRDAGYRPSISVIVACKNEEKAIGGTLERIYRSDYPQDLLEVIAIDDGSTDDTYEAMRRVQKKRPGLRLIRFPKNLGKRHGMAVGARQAHGEILVFVDSDSFLEPDALYRISQGFADPSVGASSGHSFVANGPENWLTRIQTVQYYIAFRVMKAAESVFSSVTCCSGCFAAYRRTAVLEVLDEWLDQKFLGRPATFGDDRSLTNYMLRKHRVIYDSDAHASTIVPDNLRQFLRQQLRWKKSWLRETARAAGFMWKRSPVMALSFYAGFIFPLLAPFVVFRALVYLTIVQGHPSFLYVWGVVLMGLLYSVYYLVHRRDRLWVYGILMCAIYAFILNWQLPWAILTSGNNKWGTR